MASMMSVTLPTSRLLGPVPLATRQTREAPAEMPALAAVTASSVSSQV